METFKPEPSNAPPLRNCGNCVHRYEERMPQQLVTSLVCHRFPPNVVAIPIGNNKYQLATVFPIVQAGQFCHSHDYRPDPKTDAPVPVTDPAGDSSAKDS